MSTPDLWPELTPAERALLERHLELSGAIQRVLALRTFLKDQVHAKRSTLKRTRWMPDAEIEPLYSKVIFGGRSVLTSWQAFPCTFRSALESLFVREVKHTNIETVLRARGINLCDVYCNPTSINLVQCSFDAADWALDNPANDKATLLRFRDQLVATMERAVGEVQAQPLDFRRKGGQLNALKAELKRYVKKSETMMNELKTIESTIKPTTGSGP